MTEKDFIVKESINKQIDDSIGEFKNNKKKIIEKIQKQFQIQLDSEIIERMIKNNTFRNIISEIDLRLSEYLKGRDIKAYNKMHFQSEWEAPEIVNIILFLHFNDPIVFEEQLKIWNEIIKYLETNINNYIRSSPEDLHKDLDEFQRRFYILLDFE